MRKASPSELQCINMARVVRLTKIKKALKNLIENGEPFDMPIRLSGLSDFELKWKSKVSERILQIIVVPPLLLLFYLLNPVAYVLHHIEIAKNKWILRSRIRKLRTEATSVDVPEEKTIGGLWKLHGLEIHSYGYSSDEILDLLGKWIDTLYVTGYSETLDLHKRVNEIARQHGEANRTPDLDIYFAPPVVSLINQLFKELPPYE